MHASTTSSPSIPDISLFLEALKTGGKIWETAARYCRIVERVIDELVRSDGNCRTMQILGDMRMTAWSVDVMIHRQPDLSLRPAETIETGGNLAEGNQNQVDGTQVNQVGGNQQDAPAEGDWVDVFAWFNFPRVPAGIPVGREGSAGGGQSWVTGLEQEEQDDWLFQV